MALTTANATKATVTAPSTTGLGRFFSSISAYFERRRRVNETIAELNEMSDRELNDIGVSRADIRRIAEEAV